MNLRDTGAPGRPNPGWIAEESNDHLDLPGHTGHGPGPGPCVILESVTVEVDLSCSSRAPMGPRAFAGTSEKGHRVPRPPHPRRRVRGPD